MTRGGRNLIILGVGSAAIALSTTWVSLAIYHNSGDIYLDRSRPGFLPDEKEIEQEEGVLEEAYEFAKTGPVTKAVLEEYLEQLQTEIAAVEGYKEPFGAEALADKTLGLPEGDVSGGEASGGGASDGAGGGAADDEIDGGADGRGASSEPTSDESPSTDDSKAEVLTSMQKAVLKDHCSAIRDTLKTVQHNDSRARVYLGRRYEVVLTQLITALNVRLVENNLSTAELIENQNQFAKRRTEFMNDYIGYQQALEELVNMDCEVEPEKFYAQLTTVQEKRGAVEKDTNKLAVLMDEQKKLVEKLAEKVK